MKPKTKAKDSTPILLNRIWAHSGFMPLTLSAFIRSYLRSRKWLLRS